MTSADLTAPVDVYARVSRRSDREQRSTTGQVAACRAVLMERGLRVGQVLVDDGRSAWNSHVIRPAWEALMTRLESGAAAGVIVFDLERFTRQPEVEGGRLIAAAERGLLVLDSESAYDLTTTNGKKNFRDAMTAAAYYSDRLSDRTKRGKAQKALSGQVDARRSFGFEPDGVTIREDEAAVLRDCAARLLAGETQDDLIRGLNERGVPAVRGAAWGYTTFRQLMTRPRTAGLIAHNGTVVAKLPGRPILDEATYARICDLYTARRPGRPPSSRYLLTGLVFCHCGAALGGRPVTGTPRRQYWCKAKHADRPFVGADPLETWAADWTIRTLADPEHAEALERADRELAAQREQIQRDIYGRTQTAKAMADRLARDELEMDEYSVFRDRHGREIAKLRAALKQLDAAEPVALPPGQRRGQDLPGWDRVAALADWEDGTTAERRAMLTRALAGHRIVVGPGRPATFDPERVSVA